MTPEFQLGLANFERALDDIRRYIESMPEQASSKSLKFRFSAVKFDRESWRLKGTLNAAYKALIELPKKSKSAVPSGASRTEGILEIAAFGTRAAAAICDVPVPGLAFGKPAVAIVGLICETVKTVKSNRTSAHALARHAQNVTDSIVDRAHTTEHDGSLTELCRALQQVQEFLTILQNRRRVTSWAFAVKDRDRFTELNSMLDRALQVFSASENLVTSEIVRSNTQQLVTVVATVNRVETDVQRTMTLVHSSLKEIAPRDQTQEEMAQGQTNSFRSIFVHQTRISLFFFRSYARDLSPISELIGVGIRISQRSPP
ncbi:hypothetical protein DFH06DRAFT_620037 [Mycena polygramma]|nr:hypothetical protein DFH06DRAFT_620037 [Mycena polygramma]